jgi:hypothetical protein
MGVTEEYVYFCSLLKCIPLSLTNKLQRYTISFIAVSALYVLGGFSAHHQELRLYAQHLVCVRLACCLPLAWVSWQCQRDATLYNVLYCCQCSTCFRRFFRPSSGAQTVHTASGMSQACLLPTASVDELYSIDGNKGYCITLHLVV